MDEIIASPEWVWRPLGLVLISVGVPDINCASGLLPGDRRIGAGELVGSQSLDADQDSIRIRQVIVGDFGKRNPEDPG